MVSIPLVCDSRINYKSACELAGHVGMTYALIQPTNLHESENAFVAPYRIDMQMVG